jgi:hypothetical protein
VVRPAARRPSAVVTLLTGLVAAASLVSAWYMAESARYLPRLAFVRPGVFVGGRFMLLWSLGDLGLSQVVDRVGLAVGASQCD